MVIIKNEVVRNKNKQPLLKRTYHSKENNITIESIRYTPYNISKKLLKNIIDMGKVNSNYHTKIKNKRKKDCLSITSFILSKLLCYYFEWVILKCIEGYRVMLFNDERYLFFIHPYFPNDVEKNRMANIERIKNRNIKIIEDKTQRDFSNIKTQPISDYKGRRFRLSLFKKDTDGQYYYSGYFIKLNMKHKEMLRKEIKQNNSKYDYTLQF